MFSCVLSFECAPLPLHLRSVSDAVHPGPLENPHVMFWSASTLTNSLVAKKIFTVDVSLGPWIVAHNRVTVCCFISHLTIWSETYAKPQSVNAVRIARPDIVVSPHIGRWSDTSLQNPHYLAIHVTHLGGSSRCGDRLHHIDMWDHCSISENGRRVQSVLQLKKDLSMFGHWISAPVLHLNVSFGCAILQIFFLLHSTEYIKFYCPYLAPFEHIGWLRVSASNILPVFKVES